MFLFKMPDVCADCVCIFVRSCALSCGVWHYTLEFLEITIKNTPPSPSLSLKEKPQNNAAKDCAIRVNRVKTIRLQQRKANQWNHHKKQPCPQVLYAKIVVVKGNIMLRRDEEGITTMGLKQFMPDPDSLDL